MGICSPTNRLRQPPPIQTGCAEEYEVEYIHGNQTHYQKPQYYVKKKEYPLEKVLGSRFNLTNAQEAVQLYLNKKNWKGGPSGEEGDSVRIDNSSSLETRAQEQGSNPKPGILRAAGPVDHRTACLCFLGLSPHKLIPRMLTHAVKRAKPKKSLHQMEDQSLRLIEVLI
ncbi:hypothetical protein DSO57_1013526 [Entomophthora muscae]|uniref:Uncharacterized protein n=1 Tax=Entomophthora muscae TaxID=34485 RepID=A0ACC2UEJ7_9FUNG|nr:hypothetical protein DSO57_1013526 [Entomophthora muscae]